MPTKTKNDANDINDASNNQAVQAILDKANIEHAANKSAKKAVANGKKDINFKALVNGSPAFQALKEDLILNLKLSLTGMVNLVVNHEDPCLVDEFLKHTFRFEELYNNTFDFDAVELQQGAPGKGFSRNYIDKLIYGEIDAKEDENGIPVVEVDPRTGERKRKPNGFVSRKEVVRTDPDNPVKDKTLIIKNIDYSLDFCRDEGDHCDAGTIDSRSLYLFDKFRNPMVKKGCRLLLISNVPLKLPFKIRSVNFQSIDSFEAKHIIEAFTSLYKNGGYSIEFTHAQEEQMCRKIIGLTYTEGADAISHALAKNRDSDKKIVNSLSVLKSLRERINQNFMENGHGLTHLSARPWEDYICPESSNFTFDVEKMMRDFKEIKEIRDRIEDGKSVNDDKDFALIEAIQTRLPHVLVLHGKGGVGKSAFPVHLAGLLGFDVWDFNVNATHSKWIGEGSERMRESIDRVMKSSHLIVRIDEYDRAMGSTGEGGNGMHEAHKQVESEFMNWLQNAQEENLFKKQSIILVLTTNHKENITGPLLRSGRADLVIDIDNFDAKSMKETLLTTARRMHNRGVSAIGYNQDELHKAITSLNLDDISEICTAKGFTVRDIEMLVIEMAAHNYYFKKDGKGIEWTTANFIKVVENSQGSTRNETTGELKLGDREVLFGLKQKDDSADDRQEVFDFEKDHFYDKKRIQDLEGFKQC